MLRLAAQAARIPMTDRQTMVHQAAAPPAAAGPLAAAVRPAAAAEAAAAAKYKFNKSACLLMNRTKAWT